MRDPTNPTHSVDPVLREVDKDTFFEPAHSFHSGHGKDELPLVHAPYLRVNFLHKHSVKVKSYTDMQRTTSDDGVEYTNSVSPA